MGMPFIFSDRRGASSKGSLALMLFLLVVESLSIRLINQEKSVGSFFGINLGGTLHISHLLFLDDIMISCNRVRREATKLK